jgi:hypothetical protein
MLNAIQQIEKSFPFKIHPAADFLVMRGKLPSTPFVDLLAT